MDNTMNNQAAPAADNAAAAAHKHPLLLAVDAAAEAARAAYEAGIATGYEAGMKEAASAAAEVAADVLRRVVLEAQEDMIAQYSGLIAEELSEYTTEVEIDDSYSVNTMQLEIDVRIETTVDKVLDLSEAVHDVPVEKAQEYLWDDATIRQSLERAHEAMRAEKQAHPEPQAAEQP